MIKKIIYFLFISILIVSGCKKDTCSCGYVKIEYGTSFGECMGYCKRDISITSDKIVFTKSGWDNSVKTKHCDQDIADDDFSDLTGKIDLQDFKDLDEVIGCPDCADGGAEWIRIVTPDSDKKVTFEYGNEPDEVKAFIEILRNYLKGFENCD
ncbi:MAG: hypothetical protein NTV01_21405 [Bacteroidia bacterium]|nr:hypothetical protein [Bacteroidia bacterium]